MGDAVEEATKLLGQAGAIPRSQEGPKGWRCHSDGHILDDDFPISAPIVQATKGAEIVYYAYPGGRCKVCQCMVAHKEQVPEPSAIMKPEDALPGGLIKPA